MKALLGFLFLIFAPQIFAGPFDPPPTDKSIEILGSIFGSTVGDFYLGGVPNPILYKLIEKLNFTIIALGAIVVSYVSVTSVLHTAQEGSMLGKSWSSLWIPLRSIIGLSLMVPTPATGYCLIQVGVMWLILQGVGIADIMWNITLDGLANGVSAVAGTITDSSLIPVGEQIAPNVMDAAICMQSVMFLNNPQGNSFIYRNATQIHGFDEINKVQTAAGNEPFSFGTDARGYFASVTGTKFYGFNNTNLPQPDAKSVCGSIKIAATVTLSEYPQEIQDMYIGANATLPISKLQTLLADEAMLIYNTKIAAYDAMMDLFKPIAQGFANGQFATPNIPNQLKPPAPPGAKSNAGKVYSQFMSGLVVPNAAQFKTLGTMPTSVNNPTQAFQAAGTFVSNTVTIATSSITDFSDTTIAAISAGQKNGWISAGSFYFILNKSLISTQFNAATGPFASNDYDMPSCSDPNGPCLSGIKFYGVGIPEHAQILNSNIDQGADQNYIAQNLADGYYYMANDTASTPTQLTFGADSEESRELFSDINNFSVQIMATLSSIFNGTNTNTDPLLAHAKFGTNIMRAAESVFTAIIFKMMKKVPSSGGPAPKNIMIRAALALVYFIVSLLLPFLGIMWSFGALLAIYCPLIPFMFFAGGALGWFLTVTEAMIGAPIIALSLLLPAGEEFDRVKGAGMILANLFFRPTLMIFGFLFAGKVYKAIVSLIDFGMGAIFQTIDVATLFSVVVVLVVYVMFIISATNLCFALIYSLPDKALRWIGGKPEQTKIGDIEAVKGAAQDAAGKIGSGMQGYAEKGMKQLQEQIKKAAVTNTKGGKNK